MNQTPSCEGAHVQDDDVVVLAVRQPERGLRRIRFLDAKAVGGKSAANARRTASSSSTRRTWKGRSFTPGKLTV